MSTTLEVYKTTGRTNFSRLTSYSFIVSEDVEKHVTSNAVKSVMAEMVAQDKTHGAERHQTPAVWFPIFVEEVGEVATAMQEKSNLREELVQVAAVALQWIEDIDRDGVNL